MGKIDIEYKYPCGYNIKIVAKSFLLKLDLNDDLFKSCPLHVDKCNKWLGVEEYRNSQN